MRKTGGSLASENVEAAVGCSTYTNMSANFDNHLMVNVFKGGALIKREEIQYRIFNEQLGGTNCSGCADQQANSVYTIGKPSVAPSLAVPDTSMHNIWDAVPRNVLTTQMQPSGTITSINDNVVVPQIYTEFSNPVSLYNLHGGKLRFPSQKSPAKCNAAKGKQDKANKSKR